jgi:hypothetical protein
VRVGLATWVLMILGRFRVCDERKELAPKGESRAKVELLSYVPSSIGKPHREGGRDLWTWTDVIEGYGSIFGIGIVSPSPSAESVWT